jgi:hypothetical protein
MSQELQFSLHKSQFMDLLDGPYLIITHDDSRREYRKTLSEDSYRNKTHDNTLCEYRKAHTTQSDTTFIRCLSHVFPMVMASKNTKQLTQPNDLSEVRYHKYTHDNSLKDNC